MQSNPSKVLRFIPTSIILFKKTKNKTAPQSALHLSCHIALMGIQSRLFKALPSPYVRYDNLLSAILRSLLLASSPVATIFFYFCIN